MIQRYNLTDWYEDDRACETKADDGEWMAAADVLAALVQNCDGTHAYRLAVLRMGFTSREFNQARRNYKAKDATQSETADTGTG